MTPPTNPPRAPPREPFKNMEVWRVLDGEQLRTLAADHPNQPLVTCACDGIRDGMDDTSDFPDLPPRMTPNAKSGLEKPEVLVGEVQGEVIAGRFQPICTAQDFNSITNGRSWPMGLVKKKTYAGPQRWRPTTNLSKEVAGEPSLNGCMLKEQLSVSYITPLDCAAAIAQLGDSAAFNKFDQTKAYRQVGRSLAVIHRHMITLGGMSYCDRALSFGSSSAPLQYTAIMSIVSFVIHKALCLKFGEENVVVLFLLDDLATVLRTKEMADQAYDMVIKIYTDLGFDINEEKSERGLTEGEWLGLWFTIPRARGRHMSLPPDKHASCLGSIKTARAHDRLMLKFLETLGGRLNYACCVFPRMRPYLNELWRPRAGLGDNYFASVKSTQRFRDDMVICQWFLQHGAPRPIAFYESQDFSTDHPVDPGTDGTVAIIGDASGDDGFGFASTSGHWGHSRWTSRHEFDHETPQACKVPAEESSTHQETYCLCAAIATEIEMGTANTTVSYYTDSRNAAMNWDKGRSKTRAINDLLRALVPLLYKHGLCLDVRFRHRTDRFQVVADELSHGRAQTLSSVFPQTSRTVIPVSMTRTMGAWDRL